MPGGSWDLGTQSWFVRADTDWAALLRGGGGGGMSPMALLPAPLDGPVALALLRRRTELREGDFPPLSEAEEAGVVRLRAALVELGRRARDVQSKKVAEGPTFQKAWTDDDY